MRNKCYDIGIRLATFLPYGMFKIRLFHYGQH